MEMGKVKREWEREREREREEENEVTETLANTRGSVKWETA